MSIDRLEQKTEETRVIPDWELERHHLPQLAASDSIISNMERLIWEKEFEKHLLPSNGDIDAIIRSPEYNDPLALLRNQMLGVRNEIARRIGIKERGSHEWSQDALGYRAQDGHVIIGNQAHPIDQTQMHMIRMR